MKDIVTQIHKEVVEYFASTDYSQIGHTEAVHNFAQLLGKLEAYDDRRQAMIEISALLHDIGCPNAKEKYGNTNAPNQEKEGKPKAAEILAKYELKAEDKALIAEAVGCHHHIKQLQEMGFELLAEADLIVNLLEGYYKMEQAQNLYETCVSSARGKELFKNMFLK